MLLLLLTSHYWFNCNPYLKIHYLGLNIKHHGLKKPLIIGKPLNMLSLELSIKILSTVEHEVLLNLEGKSTIYYKLCDCRRHDNSSLKLELLHKSTFKSPHMINSIIVLCKYFKVESNWSKKLKKLPAGDL